jgi:hypothetical protein
VYLPLAIASKVFEPLLVRKETLAFASAELEDTTVFVSEMKTQKVLFL